MGKKHYFGEVENSKHKACGLSGGRAGGVRGSRKHRSIKKFKLLCSRHHIRREIKKKEQDNREEKTHLE